MVIKLFLNSIFCLSLIGGVITPVAGQGMDDSFNSGMVLIPAGEFTMGSNHEENVSMFRDANALNPFGFNEQLYVNERPAHKVTLPAFLIDKYEVTDAQYRDFAIATQHRVPPYWVQNGYNFSKEFLAAMTLDELRKMATERFKLDMDVPKISREDLLAEMAKVQTVRDKYPVTSVSWDDANEYCTWAGKRLPSEAEWEKAARGPNGNEYPWGNKWIPKNVNTMSEDPDTPYSAAGSFPEDKSVYGVYDMAANVAEWVNDWYDAYPGAPADQKIKSYGKVHRVIRGGMASSGHYDSISVVFRAAHRTHLPPKMMLIDLGFRCAKNVE